MPIIAVDRHTRPPGRRGARAVHLPRTVEHDDAGVERDRVSDDDVVGCAQIRDVRRPQSDLGLHDLGCRALHVRNASQDVLPEDILRGHLMWHRDLQLRAFMAPEGADRPCLQRLLPAGSGQVANEVIAEVGAVRHGWSPPNALLKSSRQRARVSALRRFSKGTLTEGALGSWSTRTQNARAASWVLDPLWLTHFAGSETTGT